MKKATKSLSSLGWHIVTDQPKIMVKQVEIKVVELVQKSMDIYTYNSRGLHLHTYERSIYKMETILGPGHEVWIWNMKVIKKLSWYINDYEKNETEAGYHDNYGPYFVRRREIWNAG